MKTYKLSPEQRFDLVMECRSSGLTDYQWCKEKGISTSTFYRWIALFREKGFPNVPYSMHQHDVHKAVPQEVVKLSLNSENCDTPVYSVCETSMEQNAPILNTVPNSFAPVAEITCNGISIKVSNDIKPEIAGMLLRHLGGAL